MSCSSPNGKKFILDWFKKQKDITSIVDCGCGEGAYRKLLGPEYDWTAIEVWGPYIEQFNLTELYNTVIVSDLRHVCFPCGDCAIFGDVLEHMEKEEANRVLCSAFNQYKHLVVSIPESTLSKYEKTHNPFEEHKAIWTGADFEAIEKYFEIHETFTTTEYNRPVHILLR